MELRKLLLVKILGLSSLLVVALNWDRPFMTASGLIAIAGGMIYLRSTRSDLLLFIMAGISGTAAEAIGIYFGAWTYTEPFAIGVPVWLPFLWGVAALYLVTIRDTVEEMLRRHYH